MIKKRIEKLKKNFDKYNIDGYVIPKNDEFFSEQVFFDRLKRISNFSGSAGLAIIFKKKNYLFVDGRYTIQAKKESGRYFNIIPIHKCLPRNILKNLKLGFDPKLFTKNQMDYYFGKNIELIPINKNLVANEIFKRISNDKLFYSLPSKITGKSHKNKIFEVSKLIKKNKSDYLFVSAPENVAWVLNIRGADIPFSPIPNCRLIINKYKNFFLISDIRKLRKLISEKKISKKQIINPKNFEKFINNLKGKKIMIDAKTCSIYNERIIKSKFEVILRQDPCYYLKSLKNSYEINNMKEAHIYDGLALTKFIYWIKNMGNKKITELSAEKKLLNLRKKNKNFLYPSFSTIAGAGANGAIIHYRANKKTNRLIHKNDIFLCDSGGQYKFGTTDVTRTMCFSKPSNYIKKIFTQVLKGHIAVAKYNINLNSNGSKIDVKARQFLKKDGLDYAHGTGHGVGFFSNVHEGPQAISKFNKLKLKSGMILSNEPGYYKEGKFGIRIENLIYVKKYKNKLNFENLTLAPIDKDLINYKMLNTLEKDYLLRYHLEVYSKLSKYLNSNERKWLIKSL